MVKIILLGAATLCLIGTSAQAAGVGGISATPSLEAGYGNARGSVTGAFNPSTRDANNNRVVQDGLIQTGQGGSQFLTGGMSGGAATLQSGAISTTNYAAGNLINLQVGGNWNTIVLNTTQINNGALSAVTTINGGTQTSTGQLN